MVTVKQLQGNVTAEGKLIKEKLEGVRYAVERYGQASAVLNKRLISELAEAHKNLRLRPVPPPQVETRAEREARRNRG